MCCVDEMKLLRLFVVLLGACAASASAYASARQCPQCSEKILESNRFCPHCGWSFVAQDPVQSPTPQPAVSPKPVPQPLESPVQKPTQVPAQQPSPDLYSTARYSYHEHGHRQKYDSSVALDRMAGTGRGLSTLALSPLNVFRGMVTGLSWTGAVVDSTKLQDGQAIMYLAILTVPVGTVFSSFAICADAINGTVDLISLGYYGDWLYDSKSSGHPTPWLWEREWNSSKIPWIDRK